MALKNSNLYAERIYSEHPLGLWTLDDDISYLQLLTDAQQDLFDTDEWSYTNLNTEVIDNYPTIPISDSPQSRFSLASSSIFTSEISSIFSVSSSSFFTDEKETACFSAHIYQTSIYFSEIQIGISYDGNDYYDSYSFGTFVGWKKISHTFDIPANKEISFFIKVIFVDDEFATNADYEFQINGVSLGQWSEQFNSSSKGFNDISIPEEISHIVSSSPSYTCTVVDSYGLDDSINGYYLIKDKQIYAQNSGLPLAFGSKNSTSILQAEDNNPSILLPGRGFLNESGRYNSYTLEAWIRLDNTSADRIKIIGPVFSDDGIYVEEGFISIRVGGACIKSYYVGKWYRPMLVHFKYNQNYASLYINGEEVIIETIDVDNIDLPAYDNNGDIQDWIGVYGNDLIKPFEIDCISILPYDLPLEMAKRRFVYGQGVGEIDLSNSVYKAETILFDYPTSEYANNFIYPDMNRWRDASSVNLDTSSSYISAPSYELPEFISKSTTTYEYWAEGNREINISSPDSFDYFTMKPYEDIIEPSLYYDSINITNENVVAISGVFKSEGTTDIQQPLMIFNNKSTYESLRIVLDPDLIVIDGGDSSTTSFEDFNDYGEHDTLFFTGTDDFGDSSTSGDEDLFILKYIYTSYDGYETIIHEEEVSASSYFTAGINIQDLQANNYETIGNFFSSLDNISMTIGKYENDNFLGKIFAIHFSNSFTYEKDLSTYFEDGVVLQEVDSSPIYQDLINHTSSYSLIPIAEVCKFMLDIGIYGYWEDAQPLSYFGKYVLDSDGNKYYDLDMIQLNVDSVYPDQNGYLDTSLVSYVTLKDFSSIGSATYSSYINSASPSSNSVIEFDLQEALNTKYEFKDKTIIIPPADDFENYYIGLHLEIKVRGISTRRFIVRRLELASLAFNDALPTNIGTRYSENVIPFTRIGEDFDYKAPNPITIYKDTSPFLYLTDDSGLFVNEYSVSASAARGFYSDININEDSNYIFGATQMWARYQSDNFGESEMPMASIFKSDDSINIVIEPETGGKRAFVNAYNNSSGDKLQNIIFFQDGEVVESPVMYPKRWTSIIISFLEPIPFDDFNGRIEFYEGILFNNIVKYLYSNDSINTFKSIFAKWYQILYNENNDPPVNTWYDIENPEGISGTRTWIQATAAVEPNQYTINGEDIYNNLTGLSVSVTDDTSRLNVYSNGVDVMTDVVWQQFEKSPV